MPCTQCFEVAISSLHAKRYSKSILIARASWTCDKCKPNLATQIYTKAALFYLLGTLVIIINTLLCSPLLGLFRENETNLKFKWTCKVKNPAGREATSWLFSSVAEDFNSGRPRTNPASGQSGTRTRDRGIASPTRWSHRHAASFLCQSENWCYQTNIEYIAPCH